MGKKTNKKKKKKGDTEMENNPAVFLSEEAGKISVPMIDENLISLAEAAKQSGYTPEHLNLSARKGKLEATKIGRNWYTTNEALEVFLNLSLERKGDLKKREASKNIQDEIFSEGKKTSTDDLVSETNDAESEERLKKISDEAKEKKSSSGNFARSFFQALPGIAAMVIVVPLVLFSVYSVKFYSMQKKYNEQKIALVNSSPTDIIMNENENNFSQDSEPEVLGIVSGEETAADPEAEKKSGVVLASENFKAQNVSLGVGIVLASADENLPLEISDIKSESFITGKKNNGAKEEVKLVISWKTNKPSISEVNFSKNNGQDQKNIKEDSFGFNHAVIITGIEPRTSYVYQIKSKDHWAAEVASDFFGIFTASKPVSVFDLISEQINQIFGWAIKQ